MTTEPDRKLPKWWEIPEIWQEDYLQVIQRILEITVWKQGSRAELRALLAWGNDMVVPNGKTFRLSS